MIPHRLLFAAVLALLLAADAALACACCTNPAQRLVETRKMNPAFVADLARLRFQPEARLKHLESSDDTLKRFGDPLAVFALEVTHHKDRIVFAFRGEKGKTGTLSLLQPRTLSVFEVDPRDGEDAGFGPSLYKEWKLTTAVAADGIFRDNAGPSRRITLVLHGRGTSCTMLNDFKYWTLLVHGPGAETYTFYGELEPL